MLFCPKASRARAFCAEHSVHQRGIANRDAHVHFGHSGHFLKFTIVNGSPSLQEVQQRRLAVVGAFVPNTPLAWLGLLRRGDVLWLLNRSLKASMTPC
jgi:hypothetical protein